MARRRTLGVWLGDERVATLEQRRFPELRLRYEQTALERWPANSPVISCALPLASGWQDALPFCKGLMPEGRALQALAEQAGVATNAVFELLARYGRDVAGALVIAEQAPEHPLADVEPYTRDQLTDAVEALDEHPLGVDDDSELSLAGLQDKLLLVRMDDGWGRPLRGRPSTHILKRDDPLRPGLVRAEGECLALAHALGLTTSAPQVDRMGAIDCLIVERFDRAVGDGVVRRLHQEDACQALGVDPQGARGAAKYERAGGPRLAQVAELLDVYAADGPVELDRLVAAVTFTVLIGNADAHGKNVALLHPTAGTVALAPLYDTVPTLLWPRLRTRAAMSIGGRVPLREVTLADVVAEARSWSHPAARAERVARELIEQALAALEREVVPRDSPVAGLVHEQAARLLSG
ncbi:MAG: HipA domain-containing protein [Actinobacteria bacterium]|nr:HipA domain-containing protein [Actinomycetota bacterium]